LTRSERIEIRSTFRESPMPIQFECSSCGADLRVKDEFAGRRITCRECKRTIEVPRRGAGRRRPASDAGGTKKFVALGVGALAFAIAFFIAFRIVSSLTKKALDGQEQANQFAPGGVPVDVARAQPAAVPAATPAGPSRFDLPLQTAQPQRQPATTVRPVASPRSTNPSAGTGLGNVVGVTSYWKDQNRHGGRDSQQEYETLGEEPDVLPPVGWSVDVDPPATPLEFNPDRKNVRVQVPTSAARATSEDIVFPVMPTGIVAVGQNAAKGDTRDVWDLTKPEKIGTIRGLAVETSINAVSPDGLYFAGVTGRARSQTIGVWDVAANTAIVDISTDLPGDATLLAIPRPNLLVAGASWGGAVRIYDLPSGQPLHGFDVGWPGKHPIPPAFSPGGRYMAVARRDRGNELITVYDLETGQPAGDLTLPEYDVGWGLSVHGMAFSLDGTELAAIVDAWSCSKVLIWKVSDGTIAGHMTFNKLLKQVALGDGATFGKALPLVWFPGGKRLLAYETAVLDRDLGGAVWQIPGGELRDNFPGKRWPLSPTALTTLSTTGRNGFVAVYELPEDKIAQAKERITKTAARKPTIPMAWVQQGFPASPNIAGARVVAPRDVAWSMQPDPAPPPVSSARPVSLEVPKGSVKQVAVSRTGTARALALRSTAWIPWSRIPGGNVSPDDLKRNRFHSRPSDDAVMSGGSTKPRAWIDVYDLAGAKRTIELRLPYDGDLLTMSPDGTQFIVLEAGDSGRIDVYSTDNGGHVAGWQPYRSEAGELGKLVVSAAMPDDDHVVTLSGDGQLVAWRLPDATPVFLARDASQPSFSSGGRFVGYSDGKSYHFVELATGEPVGRIPDVGDVAAAAFHRDGTRFALLSSHKGGYYLFTADVTSGQVSPPFPVPVLSGHFRWFGDRYVLIDNRKLVDVEQRVVAWSYDLPAGDHLPVAPDARHWFLADVGGKPMLNAAEVPDRTALSRLGSATLAPEFILQPGQSCTLSVQFNHPALDGAYRQEIEKKIAADLAGNRITVAAGQPVTLALTATEQAGATITHEYRGIGFGSGPGVQEVSYQGKTGTCRAAFTYGGETAWETSGTSTNDQWFVSRSENESIEQAVQRQYHASVQHFFRNLVLPPYVFTPKSANGLGATQLASPPVKESNPVTRGRPGRT
jgi:WD40 repeat protein